MITSPVLSLPPNDQEFVKKIVAESGQGHIFQSVTDPKIAEGLVAQLREADRVLQPGGISDYVKRGKKLLADSKAGVNVLAGCKVSIPHGVSLVPGGDDYANYENIGESELPGLCFCLVAGGLGERLGYPGIKISLPVETQTSTQYMNLFAQHILEFQGLARIQTGNHSLELPLAIMTSADTHDRTVSLLTENLNFGLSNSQVTLMQQGKVPAFKDSEGRIAVSASGQLEMKPHGHGDVHGLLLQTGLVEKWKKEGRKWLFFFQDTNSVSMRALCAIIGVSKQNSFAMNSLTVPRVPGEASGGICKLSFPDGREITSSVEYNLLGPLLEPQGGDQPGADGNSAYPGNANALLFDLDSYVPALVGSKGVVPEFVNPKYADATKTSFKSPTRLECLMQDFALLLSGQRVGFVSMPRWLTFSVVKNATSDAAVKVTSNQPPDCAFSGEVEYFNCCLMMLSIAAKRAGFTVTSGAGEILEFLGVGQRVGARICLSPSFGATIERMKERITGSITFGKSSSLVVSGTHTRIGNLMVDGAFVVSNARVDGISVSNPGWVMEPLSSDELKTAPNAIAIRGFRVSKKATAEVSGCH